MLGSGANKGACNLEMKPTCSYKGMRMQTSAAAMENSVGIS